MTGATGTLSLGVCRITRSATARLHLAQGSSVGARLWRMRRVRAKAMARKHIPHVVAKRAMTEWLTMKRRKWCVAQDAIN
jgi:hypothetical protein